MLGTPPQPALERQGTDQLEVRLRELASCYSTALVDLVRRSLALDPLARPQSVYAMQKLLRPAKGERSDPHPTDAGGAASLLSRLRRVWN